MPIEFTCSGCGQMLRVGDDAAGKRAKCPNCQSVLPIPAAGASPFASAPQPNDWDRFSASAADAAADAARDVDSPFAEEKPNPFAAPPPPKETSYGPADWTPFRESPIQNVPTDVGSVLNYAVEVWKENLGLLVGVTVVIMCIDGALSYGTEIMMGVLRRAGQREMVAMMLMMSTVGRIILDTFLSIGYWQMTFKMARRQRVEFADLFNGGPHLLPTLGIYILFGLVVAAGYVLCIVPGIIAMLVWWPCYFLVIDKKCSVMDSFGLAREITANNIGTTFLLWIVSVGISLAGLLACCVGIVLAAPLAAMLFSIAYLMMSGQVPLNPRANPRPM